MEITIKRWVIDQMVRALTGCLPVTGQAMDSLGKPYVYEVFGESAEYTELVRKACAGEDGPNTYDWNIGIAP